MAVLPLQSTSSLPTFTLPAYSVATTSIVGAICRQGPHHSAQKSTSTGTSLRRTSWSKPESVKVNVLSPAIFSPKLLESRPPEKIQAPRSRWYNWEYAAAELFQEKSFCMPQRILACQAS